MILMIDNFDSFCYNIYQYLSELGEEVQVKRNDAITLEEIECLSPDFIVISPGPCSPKEAGISMKAIRHFKEIVPILGVCLGHQSIAEVFGANIIKAQRPVHGHVEAIEHDGRGVFEGIKNPMSVTRYHSLIVEKESLPSCLEISAWSKDGEIMGIRHKIYPIEGVQFHPEAILTQQGHAIFQNFIQRIKRKEREDAQRD